MYDRLTLTFFPDVHEGSRPLGSGDAIDPLVQNLLRTQDSVNRFITGWFYYG